jgi:hypothetical protein
VVVCFQDAHQRDEAREPVGLRSDIVPAWKGRVTALGEGRDLGSGTMQTTIFNNSAVNTYGYTHKWMWLLIMCLWPIWLFMYGKLPEKEKKGPF